MGLRLCDILRQEQCGHKDQCGKSFTASNHSYCNQSHGECGVKGGWGKGRGGGEGLRAVYEVGNMLLTLALLVHTFI